MSFGHPSAKLWPPEVSRTKKKIHWYNNEDMRPGAEISSNFGKCLLWSYNKVW